MGGLPVEAVLEVLPVLRRHTTTPDLCYLPIWDGYGDIEDTCSATAKLQVGRLGYLVYRGGLGSVIEAARGYCLHVPNLWWPQDRA